MRFLFLLLLIVTIEGSAQVWHMKRSIKWDHVSYPGDKDIRNFISFPGAVFTDNNALFPCYSEVIEWYSGNSSFSIRIVMPEYEEFSGSISTSRANELNMKNQIIANLAYASLKPFLQITIFPFRINPGTGKVQRMKNFVIRIESFHDVQVIKSLEEPSLKKSVSFSVLATGKWYKIRVTETGIYKLGFDQLKSMGFDDPSKVRIFGCGGQILPEDYKLGNKDELLPTQIYFFKGTDNIFNQGDYILFYALGPVAWTFDESWGMFRQKKNYYSDYGYYFITGNADGPDLPGSGEINLQEPPGYSTSGFDSYACYETENKSFKNNLYGMRTGKEWYGEDFTHITEQTFRLTLPDLVITEPVCILSQVLARSKDSSSFYIFYKNLIIDTLKINKTDVSDYTATAANSGTGKTFFLASDNFFDLKLKFNKNEGSAMGWLDFITVNGRSELKLSSDFLLFRDRKSVAAGQVTSFRISSVDDKVQVWDVTNPNNILKIPVSMAGTQLSFLVRTDKLREFVAFRENGNFLSPQITGKNLGIIDNQNLHGIGNPEMIILSYKDFLPAANRLADHRRSHDNLNVTVVSQEQVFNEFSSGTPDVTAIRNFMKYLYDKAAGNPVNLPRFLLLFGDGSYDNKGIDPNATNFILTYQSDNSTSPVNSYVSDDYFALLDPGESMNDGMLDIGVGRLPVKTIQEADNMVNKILDYEKPDRMGDWRNTICFIGDDEDGNIHMIQADMLADYVQRSYPDVNIGKIYLDAYQQISTPTGQKYPDVNIAFNNQVERGALIINYTGHGGTKGLAHEQILTLSDIQNWHNSRRLPLFMTATCEFSRFDEHEIVSAGEEVLLNKNGGGIALFSTTRLVYSGPNYSLNEKFYQIVFEKDAQKQYYRLGDIMKYSKNNTGVGVNKRNFSLLGDPSMHLAYPLEKIVTDSINRKNIKISIDTLQALENITISGHLTGEDGLILDSFNGIVYPTVFDKAIKQFTLGNDGGSIKSFDIRNNILYKGKASVSKGKFSFNFIMPKDIGYAYGQGKLSLYAADSLIDATGSLTDLIIGGSYQNATADNKGPDVDVFINNPNFKTGGITDENPVLFVKVFDENGINTTGNGIGHDISAIFDNDIHNIYILNDYYLADIDNYKSGIIAYPVSNLEEGLHTVTVKVWDIYNNSGSGSTEFMVIRNKGLILNRLMNFPNPFTESTWFSFEHNRAGNSLEVTIEIFNLSGELVRTLKARDDGSGFRSQPIYWDGKNEVGNFNRQGLYIYQVRVKSSDGKSSVKSGKLIISR